MLFFAFPLLFHSCFFRINIVYIISHFYALFLLVIFIANTSCYFLFSHVLSLSISLILSVILSFICLLISVNLSRTLVSFIFLSLSLLYYVILNFYLSPHFWSVSLSPSLFLLFLSILYCVSFFCNRYEWNTFFRYFFQMLCVNTVLFLAIVFLSVEAITGKSSTNTITWTATAVIDGGFSQPAIPGLCNTYRHLRLVV